MCSHVPSFRSKKKSRYQVVRSSIRLISHCGELCNKNCMAKRPETLIIWSAFRYTASSDKSVHTGGGAPDRLPKWAAMAIMAYRYSRRVEFISAYIHCVPEKWYRGDFSIICVKFYWINFPKVCVNMVKVQWKFCTVYWIFDFTFCSLIFQRSKNFANRLWSDEATTGNLVALFYWNTVWFVTNLNFWLLEVTQRLVWWELWVLLEI